MNAEINNELDDSTSTNSAGVTLFIRELVIDPDKGPITIEDTPSSILSSSSGSSSLLVDDNNNNNPNNNNNNNKTSTSCSSASTSESSACSINYLPIPKSSSGHSNASSSSTTSSSSSSSSTRSSSSKSSSSSSSSSKTSSNRRRKHRIKNKESSNTKQQQQVQNQLPAAKNIFILNAFVNGFVQLKLCADKIDYAYIVEIYWSNDTRSYVKRTYDDFVDFNKRFLSEFVESAESSDTKTNSASTPSKSGSRSPLSWSPNTRKKFNGSNTLTATTKTNEFKKDVKFFNFATNSHVILPTLPG